MGIKEIEKPSGTWCPNCRPGKGCAIYADRPAECRSFLCDWLAHDYLGPEWKPEKSKIVVCTKADRIVAYVDPSTPAAWKKSPYLEGLVHLMRALLPQNRLVYVSVAERYTLLLPDRFEELGALGEDDQVLLKTVRTGTGLEYQVEVSRSGPRSG
jgi:hypothetical protein